MFRETKTFEFKKNFTDNISISIAAFLNTNGGTLVMGAYGPDFKNADDVTNGIKRILKRLSNDISDFQYSLISFSSFPMGNGFIIIIDVDESEQLHSIAIHGTDKYFYRQSDRNIGQNKDDAERRKLNEKYGIKLLRPTPIDGGLGLYYKIGGYPSGSYYYKYMSLETALLCLENNNLRFAEPTSWPDKYEGRFYKAEIKGSVSSSNNPPLLGCCFTYRQDNEAAWKLYSYNKGGLNSICVEFKLDRNKLREQLFNSVSSIANSHNIFNLYEGCVEYWDQQRIDNLDKKNVRKNHKRIPNEFYKAFFNDFTFEKYLNLMLLKRNAFLHEQEVRFLLVPKNDKAFTKTKIDPIDPKINWADIILEVRIDARSSEYEQKILEQKLRAIKSPASLIPFDVYNIKRKTRIKI
ncbi:MAG: ATP-binding protein [Muribaculaceae bacterium]|nr:ATP-binding protein [Muribaculaceae bacterium]